MGFSLHLAPSAVGHAEAGEGLWLKGRAKTGAVVGLYPGIVYTRSHYRCAQEAAHSSCETKPQGVNICKELIIISSAALLPACRHTDTSARVRPLRRPTP